MQPQSTDSSSLTAAQIRAIRHPRWINLTGQRFGRLIALGQGTRARYWLCRCDCGVEKEIMAESLRSGHTRSCGCLNQEVRASRVTTHGQTGTYEHRVWTWMIRRCHQSRPGSKPYQNYQARGITVCDRWRESFTNFLADVGPAPSTTHQIDRIDNNGHYEPGNVRWSTPKEQSRNRRNTVYWTVGNTTMTGPEWAEATGISYLTLRRRVCQLGWPVERAVSTPVRPVRR